MEKDRHLSIQTKIPLEKTNNTISSDYIKQSRKKSSLQLIHENNQEILSPTSRSSFIYKDEQKKKQGLIINTRKSYLVNSLPSKDPKSLICNCAQVINNGLNLIINTPLIIRWSLDNNSSCSSIQKIMWSYKSSYVLSVDINMDKTNFKKNEIIEFEITVKNNTFEEMDLVCLIIDECIENNYRKPDEEVTQTSHKKSSIESLPSALKKSPIIRDINDVEVLRKIFNVISDQVQIMALSLQKDINFPKLKSGEKCTRKVRLLPIHPGLLKIDELVFHDKIFSEKGRFKLSNQ